MKNVLYTVSYTFPHHVGDKRDRTFFLITYYGWKDFLKIFFFKAMYIDVCAQHPCISYMDGPAQHPGISNMVLSARYPCILELDMWAQHPCISLFQSFELEALLWKLLRYLRLAWTMLRYLSLAWTFFSGVIFALFGYQTLYKAYYETAIICINMFSDLIIQFYLHLKLL